MVSRAILAVEPLDTGKHCTVLLVPATVIKPVGNVDSFAAGADCVMLTSDFLVCRCFGCYSDLLLLVAIRRALEEEPSPDGECEATVFVPSLLEHPYRPCAVGCCRSRSRALRC